MIKLPPLAVVLGGIAGVVALAGAVALTVLDRNAPVPRAIAPSATPAQQAPPTQGTQQVAPPAAPSTHPFNNSSVETLLDGTFKARERSDRAWLARALLSTAGRQQLNQDDLHAAHRQFLWVNVERIWLRLAQAWAGNSYSVTYDDTRAHATFKVGGALGEVRIDFTRVGNGWYFEGT